MARHDHCWVRISVRSFQIIVNGFQPVFNIHRLSDICTDVKGNTDKDVGLLRVYNSDKCQLLSTTLKLKDFTRPSYLGIFFVFEHMYYTC